MAKKSAKPKHVDPEFESQELPDEEPVTHVNAASNGKAISKADAVREALAQGKEGPEEGTDYILSQYGIEMTRQTFSSYKAQEKARGAKKQAAAPKPARKPSIAQLEKVVEQVQPAERGGIISDLAAVKALVEKLGVEEVVGIAKLFG